MGVLGERIIKAFEMIIVDDPVLVHLLASDAIEAERERLIRWHQFLGEVSLDNE